MLLPVQLLLLPHQCCTHASTISATMLDSSSGVSVYVREQSVTDASWCICALVACMCISDAIAVLHWPTSSIHSKGVLHNKDV
jgi:hypothetical protein